MSAHVDGADLRAAGPDAGKSATGCRKRKRLVDGSPRKKEGVSGPPPTRDSRPTHGDTTHGDSRARSDGHSN